MFEMLVERFSPFWGCVANSGFLSEYGYFNKVENEEDRQLHNEIHSRLLLG